MSLSSLNFGLPFFVRVVLPGAAVSVALLGLVDPALYPFLAGLGLSGDPARVVGFTALAITVGFLLWFLGDPIYEAYEGRRWPSWLSAPFTARWERNIEDLLTRWSELDQSTPAGRRENGEIWYELRQFPVDPTSNQPVATAPTKLGNILAAYEQYPELRYGMDAVFYWPRLALVMDKDTREEIDRQWAPADGLVQLSAGLLGAGALYLIFGTLAALFPLDLAGACITWARTEWMFVGLALAIASYLPYRLSWAFHVRNGERFKATFDVYLNKVADVAPISPEAREVWNDRWYALQYGEKRRRDQVTAASQEAGAVVPRDDAPAASVAQSTWRERVRDSLRTSIRAVIALAVLAVLGLAVMQAGMRDRASAAPTYVEPLAYLIFPLLVLAIVLGPVLNAAARIEDPFVRRGEFHIPPAGRIVSMILGAALILPFAWVGGGEPVGPPARLLDAALENAGVAVVEEMVARVLLLGGVIGLLRIVLGSWDPQVQRSVALVLSALAFAAFHYGAGVSALSVPTAIQYVGAGIIFGWIYLQLGFFAAVGAHWMVNVFVSISPICG